MKHPAIPPILPTLKTLMVIATVEYLKARGKKPHLHVSFRTLDEMGGMLNLQREQPTVILNITSSAVIDMEIKDNKMYFGCTSRGECFNCIIPTASIISVFNPDDKDGLRFNINDDVKTERAELEQYEKDNSLIRVEEQDNVTFVKFGKQ